MTTTNTAPAANAPKKPKRRRRWLYILGGLCIVLLLLVLLAPTLIGWFGTGVVVSQVDGMINGSVRIKSMSLGWFTGQSLDGVEVLDPQGKTVAKVDHVGVGMSLISAVTGNLNLHDVTVDGLQADLVVNDQHQTNLMQAIAMKNPSPPSPPSKEPTKIPPSLAVDAKITNAKITLTAPGIQPVSLSDVNLEAKIPSIHDPITFTLNAKSKQGDLSGDLKVDGKATDVFAADGTLTADKAQANVAIDATGLPVEGVDQLAGMQGKLAAALGASIDLHIKTDSTAAKQQLALSVKAPRAQVNLNAAVADGALSLTGPSSVHFTLTNDLVHKLAGDWTLASDVPTTLSIDTLHVPVGQFDPGKVAVQIHFTAAAPIQLTGDEKLGQLTLKNLAAAVESKDLAQGIDVSLTSEAEHNAKPGKIAVQAKLADLFDAAGKLQTDKLNVHATADVQGVPTALVDRLGGANGLITDALGNVINLSATANSTGSAGNLNAKLSIDTPNLEARDLALTLADRVTVHCPSIAVTLTPALVQRFVKGDNAIALTQPTKLTLVVNELSAPKPVTGQPAFDPAKTKLDLTGSMDTVHLVNVPQVGKVDADKLALNVHGETLSDIVAKLSATLAQPPSPDGKPGLIRQAAGGNDLALAATIKTGLNADKSLKAVDAEATAKGPTLNASLAATLPGDFASVTTTQPVHVQMTATPELLNALHVTLPPTMMITGPTPIDLTVDQMQMPLKGFAMDKLHASMALKLTAASPSDPVAVLAGPDLKLTASILPVENGTQVQADVESKNATASLSGSIDANQQLHLVKPAAVKVTLTPAMMQQLKLAKPDQPTLAGDTPIAMTINTLSMPLAGFSLDKVDLAATTKIDALRLTGDKRLAGAALTDTEADLKFDGSTGSVEATLEGSAAVEGQAAPSPLNAHARITHLLGPDHQVTMDAAAVDASVHFQGLPTSLIETFAASPGKLTPLVGPTLSAVADVKLTGGLAHPKGTVDLKADAPQLSADAGVNLADTITLSRPATVQVTLTPAGYAALSGEKANHTLVGSAVISATINKLNCPMKGPDGKFDFTRVGVDASLAIPKLTLKETKLDYTVTLANLTASASAASLNDPITVKLNADAQATEAAAAPANNPQANAGNKPGVIRGALSNLANAIGGNNNANADNNAPAGGAVANAGNADAAPANAPAPVVSSGKIAFNATLSDVFKSDHSFNRDALSATADAHIVSLPGDLLEALFGNGDGKLKALVGANANVDLTTNIKHMSGPVVLKLDTTNVKADLPAQLNDGKTLTLTSDATAQFTVTEDLSAHFLEDPLLKEAVQSVIPAKLTLYHDGFSFPIKDYALDKIQIAKATVDPGKLIVKNGGVINILVTLPQQVGSVAHGNISGLQNALNQNTLTAWFSRMDFSLTGGTLNLGRMDMLLGDDYQVATWGTLDMVKDHGHMVLGITDRALEHVYGINAFKDDPNYVDQFIMDGPLASLSPNKGELTARIALLTSAGTASQIGKIGKVDVGGVVDKVIGGVHSIGEKIKKSDPAPAPNTPFPWPPAKPITNAAGNTSSNTNNTNTAPSNTNSTNSANNTDKTLEDAGKSLLDLFGKKKKKK